MKTALLLVANVAIVGAGLLTYDVLRAPPSPVEATDTTALVDRLDSLEDRLGSLGSRGANGGERRLETRLLQLEQRVAKLESATPAASTPAAETVTEIVSAAPDADAIVRALENDEDALAAVAAKMAAARDRERAAEMVAHMTERLGLTLTEEERAKVGATLDTWREGMRAKMRAARADGLEREDMRAILDEARGELTNTLSEFLPIQDAESIAAAVGPGGGPGRGPGGFGGRGR